MRQGMYIVLATIVHKGIRKKVTVALNERCRNMTEIIEGVSVALHENIYNIKILDCIVKINRSGYKLI